MSELKELNGIQAVLNEADRYIRSRIDSRGRVLRWCISRCSGDWGVFEVPVYAKGETYLVDYAFVNNRPAKTQGFEVYRALKNMINKQDYLK